MSVVEVAVEAVVVEHRMDRDEARVGDNIVVVAVVEAAIAHMMEYPYLLEPTGALDCRQSSMSVPLPILPAPTQKRAESRNQKNISAPHKVVYRHIPTCKSSLRLTSRSNHTTH
jgi:hypothetical protein